MAAKKRKKRKGNQLALAFKDERVPKLMGVLMLFFAVYLFIAFTSYLFTWHIDQDRVMRFSWELLLRSDLEMANWLGRLGAIVSSGFFYWGVGLSSYIIVFLLVAVGWGLIQKTPMSRYVPVIRYSLVSMVVLSVFLEFVAPGATFPFGGAFGESVNGWLFKFVGVAGEALLFVFILIVMVIWFFNPKFEKMPWDMLTKDPKGFWIELTGNRRTRPAVTPRSVEKEQARLRPGHRPQLKSRKDIRSTSKEEGTERTEDELMEEELGLDQLPSPKKDKPEVIPELDFDLVNQEKTKSSSEGPLQPGDSELEVETPGAASDIPTKPSTPLGAGEPLQAQEENRNHSEPYDPTLELSSYEHPVLPLLEEYEGEKVEIDREELEANKDQIIETLLNYKIEITKIRATIGPTITLYEIVPAPGVRISKIKNLEDDIALSLAALGIRIIAPIPGRGTIGIEVPNKKKQIVSMREVLASDKFRRAKMDLPIGLGKTINNEVFVADLAKMPHLLVAGATGQGKSVGINAIIMSILYKKHPSQVKLVLIDPKKVELFPYSALEHHFLSYLPNQEEPITTETNKVIHTLNSLCIEMDNRYDLLKKGSARNLREYNEKFVQRRLNPLKGHRFLPFIVLIIDEFADLIMTAGKEIELPIGRLAQLARAVGIHLIIATQRPSVNIITGVIKANFPARIAYKVTSKVDSRTILDAGGADQLIGRGDMLLSVGGEMVRLQGAFVDTPEVEKVIQFIAQQRGYPEPFFLPEFHGEEEVPGASGLKYSDLDEMFEDAARLIVSNQHGSTSMIQRRLKLGYNRAGRIMDQLEAMGIVGPSEGSKAREVLVYDELELEKYLEDLRSNR